MTDEPTPLTQEPADGDLQDEWNNEWDNEYGEDYDEEDDYDYDEDDENDVHGMAGDSPTNAGVATAGPGLPATPEPTPAPTPSAVPRLTPNPEETPIAVDPLDKPTQVPLNLSFVNYSSSPMGVSFDRPAGWREDSPADSNVQFTEPEAAARNGYRAMLTVRVIHKGSRQDSGQAKTELEGLLEEMAQNQMWTEFRHNPAASASLGGANGYHAYYWATFNGIPLRGRIIVVARGNSLYMVRITSTEEFFSLYEEIYRKVRDTWKFL